ncbi:MAG: cysteine hydrolase family protein, partial [Candidatus Binatia bacterium]
MPREELTVSRGTALLVMECQKGVLDPAGKLAPLAARAEEKGTIAAIARIAAVCRETGRPIVHCLAVSRPDGGGRSRNAPIFRIAVGGLVTGSDRAEPVDPLKPEPGDYALGRLHGVSPFHGTELDPILRSLGVDTVIATGVSTNVGVTGMVIEAVNHGYEVILPTDAVAGIPAEYEEMQIRFTLRNLARLSTSDEVCRA